MEMVLYMLVTSKDKKGNECIHNVHKHHLAIHDTIHSCANCNILPTTGDGTWCGGYKSCQGMTADDHQAASQDIACDGAESCVGLLSDLGLRTKRTSKIVCQGADACKQAEVNVVADDSGAYMHCEGTLHTTLFLYIQTF